MLQYKVYPELFPPSLLTINLCFQRLHSETAAIPFDIRNIVRLNGCLLAGNNKPPYSACRSNVRSSHNSRLLDFERVKRVLIISFAVRRMTSSV